MASIQKLTRKSGTVYRVFIRHKGSKTISKVFKSKKLARDYANRIESDLAESLVYGNTHYMRMQLSELIERYMERYDGVNARDRRAQLNAWLSLIGDRYLPEITKYDVRQGIDRLAKGKVKRGDGRNKSIETKKTRSNSTLNRYKATLSALLQFACDEYDLPVNVARQVRARRENDGRVRFLSEQERSALLSACKQSAWDKLYMIVIMAITTGARRSELLRLKWSDINFDHRLAYVKKTKNGEPRVLPLTDDVITELEKYKNDTCSELIFYSPDKPEQPFEFRKLWLKVVDTAQLRNFKFHDLRHTCASYLAQNGASLLQIADVLGHRQIEMTKRYSHLCVDHKKKLIDSVMDKIMLSDRLSEKV